MGCERMNCKIFFQIFFFFKHSVRDFFFFFFFFLKLPAVSMVEINLLVDDVVLLAHSGRARLADVAAVAIVGDAASDYIRDGPVGGGPGGRRPPSAGSGAKTAGNVDGGSTARPASGGLRRRPASSSSAMARSVGTTSSSSSSSSSALLLASSASSASSTRLRHGAVVGMDPSALKAPLAVVVVPGATDATRVATELVAAAREDSSSTGDGNGNGGGDAPGTPRAVPHPGLVSATYPGLALGLAVLDLSNGGMDALPEGFGAALPALRVLAIGNNQIRGLRELVESLAGLNGL
jgi:hypothetical protein